MIVNILTLDIDIPDRDGFIREFNRLDNIISTFIGHLPQSTTVSRGESCEYLVANTIARVASIQLHIKFAVDQARSRERCIAAANAIVSSTQHVRASQLGYLDPIMAVSRTSLKELLMFLSIDSSLHRFYYHPPDRY